MTYLLLSRWGAWGNTYSQKYLGLTKLVSIFNSEERCLFQVQLKFNKEVKFIKKVEYYSFLQFLVDVGSSLGLWLGLSIIGLTDLGIQLADKTSVLCKSLLRP